jgi:hypothetical protein
MRRGRTLLFVAVAAQLLGAAACLWVWPMYAFLSAPLPEDRCPGHERFNAEVWRDTVAAFSRMAPRGCMVDDLLQHHRLRGLDRAGLVGLLGQPPRTGYFSDYDLVYWLGPERGFMSIDSEWLAIKLDPAGRVAEARLVTD